MLGVEEEFLTEAAESPTVKSFRTEESLRNDLGVDLRLGTAAIALEPNRRVVIADGEAVGYTALVIATGARAREPPGMPRLLGVYTLRTIEDARALRQALRPGSRVVIIGAGFISASRFTP